MYFYVCILGAEVYERLNRHRQEDKVRRKMLDDILVHIQVKSREISCLHWVLVIVVEKQVKEEQTLKNGDM